MYSKPKDIEDSPMFKKFCRDKGIAKTTQKKYKYSLYRYAKFHNKLLEDLVGEADIEEDEGVRLNKRKLRDQIIDFRSYLIHDTDYEFETIDTSIICVKSFYRFYAITIPDIPPYPHKNSDNKNIGFDDLPNMNTVRTVIEGARKPKHKALYLFAACNGSARAELASFTYGQFLEGVLEYCPMAKTPQDIINALDGKCEELMVIPVFKMYREKTDYIYYTPITPECTQFMINYLKAEGLNLEPEDKFFQLTSSTISSTFENANNKYNWGKIGSFGYFSSHRLRKFNASVIEDQEFGNYIQGRKPSKVKEAYFKRDKKRIREKYKEHMHKFTIYAHYDILVNSEEFNKLQKENNQLRDALKKEKQKHEKEITKLKASNSAINNQIADIRSQMDNVGLETQMVELQKRAAQNELVSSTPGLMEYVMKIFEDQINVGDRKYYSDAEIDDMVRLALATKNRIESYENILTEEKLQNQYPECYGEATMIINEYKDKYVTEVLGVPLSDLQNEKVNKALLPFKKKILENKNDTDEDISLLIDPSLIQDKIDEALGLLDSVEAIYDEGEGLNITKRFK